VSKEVVARLREVIWSWDPYGVVEFRNEVPEEYDDFLESLVFALSRRASFDEFLADLEQMANARSMSDRPEGFRALAADLWDIWRGGPGRST
jgi:hypothetical protein